MELSPVAVARAGKDLEWRAAAPRAVLDSAAAGDLIAAAAVAAGRVGGSGLQQGWPLEGVPNTKADALGFDRIWCGGMVEPLIHWGLNAKAQKKPHYFLMEDMPSFGLVQKHWADQDRAQAAVEMHPMWRQRKLRDLCRDHNIHVSAYSPIGAPGNFWGSTAVIENPLIKSMALKHGATPAQVALSWGLSKGASVIAKSFNLERLKENKGALELKLEDDEILEIDSKLKEMKIMRGDVYVNDATSPYKTIQELWDDEI
ncbi:NADPH-dependent aldo-keto reductase, chloroplastic-like [Salvia splendens]|uniref:NADPH-dependent aldo-keto reductase, chloroplastic-like n=1 Tax=Salvia splendens TaxID=180675 RepID=UPI001C260865|nr:NADPH-dependent aldo-keto reductase, chloroplastic-like [Salvia splendens]